MFESSLVYIISSRQTSYIENTVKNKQQKASASSAISIFLCYYDYLLSKVQRISLALSIPNTSLVRFTVKSAFLAFPLHIPPASPFYLCIHF